MDPPPERRNSSLCLGCNYCPLTRLTFGQPPSPKGEGNIKRENKNAGQLLLPCVMLFGGVVVEVALDIDEGGALVTGTGGQVTQGADQVGQAAGGSTLRDHLAYKVAVLVLDFILNGLLQGLAGQGGEVVVSQILQLQLVGGSLQTGGVGGGDNGVGQLPDLAYGVFERAVAVDLPPGPDSHGGTA